MALEEFDANLINEMAAQQMGAPQQAVADPAAAAPPAPKPEDKPTAQEDASAKVAPKTEGNAAKADPFEFFDAGNGRSYTPEQLRGITNRYSDLNYRHQTEVAPVQKTLSYLNQLRQQAEAAGTPLEDDQLAGVIEAALTAYTSNPTIGNNGQPQKSGNDATRKDVPIDNKAGSIDLTNMDTVLAQWEQQNAVSLPPMYKDAIAKAASLEGTVQQMQEMITHLQQNGINISKTAEDKLATAQKTNADVAKQRIVNNLDRIQTEFGFADEAGKDFMDFIQGRGYDMWELIDFNLAKTLATDFKNNQNAPELERFRGITQRRQAFTGNLAPSPGGAAAPAPADSEMADIDAMTNTIMEKRFMK